MRILGIDPGIGRMGWGVIQMATHSKSFHSDDASPSKRAGQASKWQIVNSGCVETAKDMAIEKRLQLLHDELTYILTHEKPEEVAIEDLFFNTNAKTAMIVGEARGVILLTVSQHHLPIATYTPLQVKIAVTGYGRAEKKQVEKMMMAQLGIKKKPEIDDTADALAIALTHAFSYKLKKLL